MSVDSQTLFLLRTPVAIIAASLVWLFGRWVPDARGTSTWALATLCFGATGLLFAFRSDLPFFFTVVVGNILLVTGAALYHLVACRIRNASYPLLLHIFLILLIAVSFEFVFTDIKADYMARVLVSGPVLVVQSFLTAWTLLRDRHDVSREEYQALVFGAMPFILFGLGYIWWTLIHISAIAVPPEGLLSNNPSTILTRFAILLTIVFFPYVFIQINNVVSRQRLQRSEEDLRRLNEELEQLVEARTEELKSTVVQLGEEITERQQAELGIKKLNEELEQRVKERTAELEFANRELESFSYSVSHDLKAPLRAIEGFSRMLMGDHADKLDAEGLRLLNVIASNTKTMAQLIDDLLNLSRLGRQQVRKSVIDLSVLARQIFQQLREQAPERDLLLTVGHLPLAFGDSSLIRQVMMNLLTNVLKYTKPRQTAIVEIGGKDEENATIYYVKDNGVGFDKRYTDKLFGVFQRLHRGAEYEGTGVGLAIVKRIIERHGGRVWAEGKIGEGATFYFALPRNEG